MNSECQHTDDLIQKIRMVNGDVIHVCRGCGRGLMHYFRTCYSCGSVIPKFPPTTCTERGEFKIVCTACHAIQAEGGVDIGSPDGDRTVYTLPPYPGAGCYDKDGNKVESDYSEEVHCARRGNCQFEMPGCTCAEPEEETCEHGHECGSEYCKEHGLKARVPFCTCNPPTIEIDGKCRNCGKEPRSYRTCPHCGRPMYEGASHQCVQGKIGGTPVTPRPAPPADAAEHRCPQCGSGLSVTFVDYMGGRDENTASCRKCGFSAKVWQLE